MPKWQRVLSDNFRTSGVSYSFKYIDDINESDEINDDIDITLSKDQRIFDKVNKAFGKEN